MKSAPLYGAADDGALQGSSKCLCWAPLQDKHGNLKSQTWSEALHVIRQRLQGVQGDQIRGIAGKLADAESMIALKVCLPFGMAEHHL